jgi:hypothetical protein
MDAQESFLLEIVLDDAEAAASFEARDDIEDPLDEALGAAGIGEVTGGGSGMGKSNIDVEVTDLPAGLAMVRQVLRDLNVPASTVIYAHEGNRLEGTGRTTAWPVYEQP